MVIREKLQHILSAFELYTLSFGQYLLVPVDSEKTFPRSADTGICVAKFVPSATAAWMVSVSNLTFVLPGVASIFSQTRVTSFRHGVISS